MKFLMSFAVAASLTAIPVSAATVSVVHVLDPAHVASSISQEALSPTVILGDGDTLDLTIKFLGGARIGLSGESGLWPLLLAGNGPNEGVSTNGTLQFLGASANIVSGPIAFDQGACCVHVGNYFSSSQYRLDANSISFAGIREVVNIVGGSPREFNFVSLYTDGRVSVLSGAVPEPASWALMIGGFGLAGAAMRRRRATVRATYA